MNPCMRRPKANSLCRVAALALLLSAVASTGAVAGERCLPARRVSFAVEHSEEVGNDWMRAVAGVTDEDRDPARLAARINATMAAALARAKKVAGVQVKSGGYSTYPISRDGRLERWRASQDLVLESRDFETLSGLLAELQQTLEVRSVVFSVSRERRREIEDGLVRRALERFEERARLIRDTLGARSYELVEVRVDTGGSRPPLVPLRAEMQGRSAVRPPAFEAGTSKLTVRVEGTIELE
ncbi:MAG: DUF541 domain-containing protein [Candidatus Dadabacteria bacterium]|nr:MAG: DUF541 domain-containing protein [Candidatus Dadabacteria bacterium]